MIQDQRSPNPLRCSCAVTLKSGGCFFWENWIMARRLDKLALASTLQEGLLTGGSRHDPDYALLHHALVMPFIPVNTLRRFAFSFPGAYFASHSFDVSARKSADSSGDWPVLSVTDRK